MAYKLVGSVIEPDSHAGIKTDLTHQYKEGKDREAVIRYDIIDIPSCELHGGGEAVKIGKTGQSDYRHREAQLDAGCKKKKQQGQSYQAYRDLIHLSPSRFLRSEV